MESTDDAALAGFTSAEALSLISPRTRHLGRDHSFSDREHAHLLFIRWLYRSGYITFGSPTDQSAAY
jgi:hypothetical protein